MTVPGTRVIDPPAAADETATTPRPNPLRGGIPPLVWAGLMLALGVWAAARIGHFSFWGEVPFAGEPVRLPDGLASVDHPFHATRAETLRRALADGHALRWVGHHQGGYPVEFYPLGVAWLEVGLWGLLLGTLPMVVVHKLAVGLIFLLPGLAFALMARRDGWPLGVALSAFAAHVAVAGGWEHGGYTELVQWGLVTNVAAAVALLFVLLWLTAYLDHGRGRDAAGAALAAGFAMLTNPRSLIALAVVGVGVWIAALARPAPGRADLATVSRRLALVGAVAAALAAPELASLARYADLYAFVRYESYAGAADYLTNAVQAVSWPVFALGVGGVAAAWGLPTRRATRAAAVTLPLYAAVTLLLATRPAAAALVPQLEATRLMPFQRLLTIYLAAVALHVGLRWLAARVGRHGGRVVDGVHLLAVAALLVAFVAPAGGAAPVPALPPVPERGLFPVVDTVAPVQADLRAAIEAADAAAPPGTALLVLGSALSWHQRLWAPLWTDRPLFYDNWLWYWHPRHAGPPGYDFATGHAYPPASVALTLDPAYLARHAIGGVAVADETAKLAAAASSDVRQIRVGLFDAYVVDAATTVVTFDGANVDEIAIAGARVVASGAGRGGTALIRQNWFPRWRATVNGEAVPVARREDGYMSVPIPAGEVRLELVYGANAVDLLARTGSALGLAACGLFFVGGGRRRRRAAEGRLGPPV